MLYFTNMEEAYEALKERYKDRDYDIWYETKQGVPYIYIEDIYNAVRNNVVLKTIEEVVNFVNKDGF